MKDRDRFGGNSSCFGERSGWTETVRIGTKEPCEDPVRTLLVLDHPEVDDLPVGEVYHLRPFKQGTRHRLYEKFGRGDEASIQIEHGTVTWVHGVFGRHCPTGHLFVIDGGSRHGVVINTVPAEVAVIHAGDVVHLGAVPLLACGRAGAEQLPKLTAETLHEYLVKALSSPLNNPAGASGRDSSPSAALLIR